MNHSLHAIDYSIIILVLIISLSFGLRFFKRNSTSQDYFVAKGRVPSWALGMSLLATLISSVTFLGYPGTGFSSNWILLVQGLMVPIVLLGVIWFIVPLYRRVIKLSTYEYFERRFGLFARYYSSLAFVLRQFSGMGTVFFLLAIALKSMIGGSTEVFILVIGVVVIFVNFLGGIEAVIWLDVFQGFMLFISGIICLSVLLFSIDGGISTVMTVASAHGRTGFGPYDPNLKELTFWVMVINGVFYAIQKYGTDQTVVQRYLAARTDKGAINASILGILLTVPIWSLFMFIGTCLFVFYQSHSLPSGIPADGVFPYFIFTQLPTGVVGLIIAAMVSAAICSLSADLNSLAAVGVEDYYRKLKPTKSERSYVNAGKTLVLVSGIVSMLIALVYVKVGNEGVLGIIFTLYAIFSGGIVGIFLLGLLSPRVNTQGINIAIILCILFTAYAFLTSTEIGVGEHKKLLVDLGPYNFTHNKLMLGVYSHLVVMSVGYIASLFFPKPDVDSALLLRGHLEATRAEKHQKSRIPE